VLYKAKPTYAPVTSGGRDNFSLCQPLFNHRQFRVGGGRRQCIFWLEASADILLPFRFMVEYKKDETEPDSAICLLGYSLGGQPTFSRTPTLNSFPCLWQAS
jgi:hypothetical protein